MIFFMILFLVWLIIAHGFDTIILHCIMRFSNLIRGDRCLFVFDIQSIGSGRMYTIHRNKVSSPRERKRQRQRERRTKYQQHAQTFTFTSGDLKMGKERFGCCHGYSKGVLWSFVCSPRLQLAFDERVKTSTRPLNDKKFSINPPYGHSPHGNVLGELS